MVKLEDITILNDIRERLGLVTAEQIELVKTRLDPIAKGEKKVGEIAGPTQALWALSIVLGGEREMHKARAMELVDPQINEDHKQQMMIASELEDVVKEMMWAQARTDTGFWKACCLGMRSNWMLVESNEKPDLPAGLVRLLGLPLDE